jgi:hypothetical protein
MVIKITCDYYDCEHPLDVKRIVEIALAHGVLLSAQEAEKAWMEHSEIYAAQWLFLPEDDIDVWYDLPNWAKGE